MRKITGNPNFTYEIACDQMCGKGHFSMRGVIEVVSKSEYKAYMRKQRPQYNEAKKFLTQNHTTSEPSIAMEDAR